MPSTVSYAGLNDSQMVEPGVIGSWSVKDILAHVTVWEREALKYLPLIAAGGHPPRYATYGGIDAFNAQAFEAKGSRSLSDVQNELVETHERLIELIEAMPGEQLVATSRFRRRLRLDTYCHYPEHTRAILDWRQRNGMA